MNADGCIDEDLSYSLDPLTEQEKQKTLIDGISDFNIKVQVNGTTVLWKTIFGQCWSVWKRIILSYTLVSSGGPDVGGGTITRALGCNSDEDRGTIDNTEITK